MVKLRNIIASTCGLTECYALNIDIKSMDLHNHSLFKIKKSKTDFIVDEVSTKNITLSSKLIIISIYGNQCLIRKKENANQTITDIIPGVSEEDFIIDENDEYIAMIRKSMYDSIITTFGISKSVLCNIHLLPNKEQLNEFHSQATIWGDSQIHKSELTKTNDQGIWIDSNGRSYSSMDIPAIAAAIHFIRQNGKIEPLTSIPINRNLKLYKVFHLGWKLALATLLIVFSINYYSFAKLTQQASKIGFEIKQNKAWEEEAVLLKSEYDSRKRFIESRGLNNRTINAFVIDQLCSLVPKEIKLESIDTNPFSNKNGSLIISNQGILISGYSYKNNSLSNYISSLKKLELISIVELESLKKDPNKEYSVFNLVIKINNVK